MSTQVIQDFVIRAKTFALLNSSDDEIEFMFAGQTIRVPASGKVQPRHWKFDDVFHSLEIDGEYIPGTLVIRDIHGRDEIGDTNPEPVWNATKAVKHALGISGATGEASSLLAARGLSLLPSGASREEIEQLRQAGRQRWQRWQLVQAEQVVRALDQANEIRRKANVPLAPGGPDYIRALHLLNAAQERGRDEARASLGIENDEPNTDELAELIKEKLAAVIPQGAPKLEPAQIVDQLLSDPKAMALLKEQYKVRKHRAPNKSRESKVGNDTDAE